MVKYKFVDVSELDEHLAQGWKKNRIKIKTNNRDQRRWINDGSTNKAVNISELEKYLQCGWQKGKYNEKSWITNGSINKLIDSSEIDSFDGWHRGKVQRKKDYAI